MTVKKQHYYLKHKDGHENTLALPAGKDYLDITEVGLWVMGGYGAVPASILACLQFQSS